jgi:hypothetical protein
LFLFISFARPKETNQRKGRRNRAEGELGEADIKTANEVSKTSRQREALRQRGPELQADNVHV